MSRKKKKLKKKLWCKHYYDYRYTKLCMIANKIDPDGRHILYIVDNRNLKHPSVIKILIDPDRCDGNIGLFWVDMKNVNNDKYEYGYVKYITQKGEIF